MMVSVPVIWALGFGNLPLLYGLGAASLPIIIHLLNRRKFREVRFAAMRFLMAAMRKNSRRIKIEQWLLLAIRTLLILFVVCAMAKPFMESLGTVLPGQRTHRVLAIDGSLSMGYASAGTSRFDQAKAVALRLVTDAHRGDTFSIVIIGDPPRVVIGNPSPSPSEVEKELKEIVQTHGSTDLTASFEAIDRVLAASDIAQKEVIVLTDLQVASWAPRPGVGTDALKRATAKLSTRKARSVVIDLGKTGTENRAVTSLGLNNPIATVGSTVIVNATVRSFGTTSSSTRVRLIIDGSVGPEKTLDLPVGEDVPVAFSHVFNSPGDHVLEVKIDDDLLSIDNHRVLAVLVHEHIEVLLVDGDFKTEPFQAETDYLAQALSPSSDSPGSPTPVKTTVVAESQLSRRELAAYDAVVLCNIAQVTEAEVSALEAYLKQGGGVVYFGGDMVVPENANRLLFADGKGLLPAMIGPSVGDSSKQGGAPFSFNPLGFRHPIVAMFNGESDEVQAGLTSVKTWQFEKLSIPKESSAKVALAFENGDPAIVEVHHHRGVVVQVATSADTGWTTWPVHPSYPPVMEQIIMFAASGRTTERNVRVGQPLDQALPATAASASANVLDPNEKSTPTKLTLAGDVAVLKYEDTEISGIYQVKIGPPIARDSTFSVNPDPAESDLSKLDKATLSDAVPGWSFAYLTDWQGLTNDATSVSRRGDLHRPLLYLVLALLATESILAWKFGHHS